MFFNKNISVNSSYDFMIETIRSKIKSFNVRILSGQTVTNVDFLNLLAEWVECPDGSDVENKRVAQSRIIACLQGIHPTDLSLSSLQLKTMPPLFQLTSLHVLDLAGNEFSFIDPYSLSCLEQLNTLNLSYNHFTEFNASSCISSTSLRNLYLTDNFLRKLNKDSFSNVSNLENLYLDRNAISHIDADTFSKSSGLLRLTLSHNLLTDACIDVFKSLFFLQYLDLCSNKLTHFKWFPKEALNPIVELSDNLIHLNDALDLLKISEQEGVTFKLPIALDSRGFLISTVFSTDEPVPSFMHHDFLVELEAWVCSNDGSAIENKREAQSRIVGALFSSESRQAVLNLSCLNLYSIPPLTDLIHLRCLNLSKNHISEFESSVFPASLSIRKLDLSDNYIKVINPDSFVRLSNLECLILSSNLLTSIPSNAFVNFTNLVLLLLNSNRISEIDQDALSIQSQLKGLLLSNNRLSYVSPLIWRNLSKLIELNLNGNNLSSFEWPLANSACPNIRLAENPFSDEFIRHLHDVQMSQNYSGPSYFLPNI